MISTAINAQLHDDVAQIKDPGTVIVRVPLEYKDNVTGF